MMKYKRIAVKIGSNVLTRSDGTVDVTRLSALVDQVAELRRKNIEVILISSGAVASGRSEVKTGRKMDAVSSRQLYSAVGQAKLINRYYELFREYGMVCGQVLTTKENFSTRYHYLNQKNCMSVMLEAGVIPIVNENDTISITELMFTDNDELSGLIATMMNADALIILSNIDGIYNGRPDDPRSTVIRQVEPGTRNIDEYIGTSKSQFGRGGMQTKCNIARKVAKEGIEVIIANGKRDGILPEVLSGDGEVVCTRFVPAEKPVSGVKKWIAHSDSFAKGAVYVNAGAAEALTGERVSSLLFVGITRITGEFRKNDIVNLFDDAGRHIGVGQASVSSEQASELIGKHNAKPFIHYDYLCINV